MKTSPDFDIVHEFLRKKEVRKPKNKALNSTLALSQYLPTQRKHELPKWL